MPCHAPSSSSKTLSLLSAISLHRHVALRDLHSFPTRRSSDLVAIVRIAGIVSGGTIFCRSQLIVSGRRIALRAAGFLVDESLDARHDGRGKRRAARTAPGAWICAAGRAAVLCIRPAENVVMAPESVSSEKRNVGSVPHAVVRIAENPLPGRFCPSLASAAYDVGCERRSGGASTGATATGHGGLKEGPEERVVAKTCGAV